MLPKFPKSKKLEISDKPEIEKLTSAYLPYSDFNFVSLWSYNIHDQCEISCHHGNLVILFNDYITGEPFYTFLGTNQVQKVISDLLEKSISDGIRPALELVPDLCVSEKCCKKGSEDFEIEEEPSHFDYVYSVKDMIALKGRKYRKPRQAVTRFIRCVPNHKFMALDLSNNSTKRQIIKTFSSWAEQKNKTDSETENEFRALMRLVETQLYLRLHNFGIFLQDEMVAFSIYEKVQAGYYMGHFGKADHSYSGVEQYLEHSVAKRMFASDCFFLNLQQDLGISGLEHSKRLWNPSILLKKMRIRYLTT